MNKNLPPLSHPTPIKTFVLDSCDEYIAMILKQNGWRQVSKTSTTWNLKWTWKADLKEIQNLQSNQCINHFLGSEDITTKLGLCLLFKKNPIIMDTGKIFTSFYPRSYNLSCQKQEFIADFIHTGVLNFLKKVVVFLQLYYQQQYAAIMEFKKYNFVKNSGQYLKQLLKKQKLFEICKGKNKNKLKIDGKIFMTLLFYMQNIFSIEQNYQFTTQQLIKLSQYGEKMEHEEEITSFQVFPTVELLCLTLHYYQRCLKKVNGFYQDGFSNIWVVKSNHSSRGRNIALISNLKQLQNLDNGMKLIQKYIQNIWVLHQLSSQQRRKHPNLARIEKKKFDIRFWVLVKSFNPFCAYIYDEAYLRIAEQRYRLDILNETTSHLTNYSVNWKGKNNGKQGEASYLLFSHFLQYLKEIKVDTNQLKKRIHEIILETLKLVDIKENNKCFELFGFDIILDGKLNPWILQCNMSPACSPRGQLKDLVQKMSRGLLCILDLIPGSYQGWKVLLQQKAKICTKQTNNPKILKQLKQTIHRSSKTNLNMTMIGWNDISLACKKLNWNQYKNIQMIHYCIQKLRIIESFIKNRKEKNNEKIRSDNTKIGRSLKMIQTLAKIIKKRKKISLLSIMRAIKIKFTNK